MTTGVIDPAAAGEDDLTPGAGSAGGPGDERAAVRARLLQQRLAGRPRVRNGSAAPAKRHGGPIPLSAGQRQMWFLSRLEPDSWEYAAPLVLRLAGELDVARLRSAIDAVVARHEILRTRYRLVDHRPTQVIDPAGAVEFEFVESAEVTLAAADSTVTDSIADTTPAGPADRVAAATDLAYRFCGGPFDLERQWPLRVQLIEVGPADHLLTVLFHHIACDDWSVRVFLTDLRTAYLGRPLAELPVQWADHASAEADRSYDADLEFWRTELAELAPLELPTDRPRPARRDWHGAAAGFTVPPAVAHGLADLARSTDTTPFMVLLTAFQVLLGRYTGRTDVPVGTVVSTRNRPEMQELIGYGINSLVLRGCWSGDPTFAELLAANRTRVGQAFAHVAVPFARLVDELQPERDMSRTPLFQVAFAMQESRAEVIDLPGLDAAAAGAESPVARFDLTLQVEWDRDRPAATLEYATALFDSSTIRRIVAHLQRLFAAVAAEPRRPLSALPMLDDTELDLLAPAQAAVEAEPVPSCLHELLRDQVSIRPEAPAVVDDGSRGRLTYAELNGRANRLAHHLRGLGAGPESIVGVCLSRGPELVPALLGVLKADAGYLPLDPAQPSDRLGFMVSDARARIIVTTSDLRPRLGVLGGDVVVVLLDRFLWQDESAADPVVGARPDNIAYVIYTSGSTGRPKGVCVTHANVVRLLTRGHRLYGFTEHDVWPLFHSYAFDVSVWELWGALLFGGTLVMVPSSVTRSPDDFLDLLVHHRVTVLNQTPTAFRGLVALAGAGDPRIDRLAVRTVVFAGEKLEFADLAPWVARRDLTTTRLANMYGITETTVHSSYYATRPDDLGGRLGNPVGEPLADLRIYLLDPAGRPVPVGVPGEIHVGGPGVTRGYLNRPDLTAARFVPDPFGAPGGRLYRSGDLAHRSADGGLHFDGRIDDQVKIRGFRIELAEIQLALGAQPDVAEAVVVVRETTPGDKRLVAYLVPGPGSRLNPERLRDELARTLPEYMIPSAFVGLPALPLTTNGKLDKRALPAPGRTDMSAGAGFLAPRTGLERQLAQIWQDVLEVPAVGVTDSFFDLGGDSIRAVALAGALSAAGMRVSVRDLFSHRTIDDLAGYLTGGADGPAATVAGPDAHTPVEPFALIDPDDRDLLPADVVDAYPVAQAQLGMLVSMLADEDRNPYHNVTSFRIMDERPVSAPALRAAAAEVTRRHEVLRTGFDLDSYRRPLQLVYAAAQLPVQVHDLSGLDAAARRDALLEFQVVERRQVFDVRTPALLRIAAHGCDDGSWWLSITECHPILEGWSHHSLMMELLGLYAQVRDGQEIEPYAAPGVRFADFVAAELASVESAQDRDYWRRVAAVPKFSLPADWRAAESTVDPLTESYVVAVPVHDLDPALRELARGAGASLKAVMLAAHLKVLSQLTAETRFTAGLVCDGRPEVVGADRVYGMYINTLPFVHDRTARTWSDLVQQVLGREIELWPHRRFPLPAIQRAVGADSLVDVYFNYQDFRQLDAGTIDHAATLDNSVTEFGMSVSSRGGHIHLTAHPQTLDRPHAERILGMYRAVLEAMAADPDGDALAVRLPATERAGALRLLSAGPAPEVARTIPSAFAAQVARTPDDPAVHCGEHTLSYRRLAALAGDLSLRLTELGAGPERLVAVCLDRGPALVPALLGVLGSGAGYLPIEPNLPPERIAFLLADAGVQALVTDAANAGLLEGLLPGRVLVVDPDAIIDPAAGPATFPEPDVQPDGLAYVMYTSGSTGAPKGVMATHANVLGFLAAAGDRFGFSADDVWAAVHSFGFDVSVWEIFGALLAGGQVVVLPWSTVRSPDDLIDALVRYRVTVLDQTPSAFRGLVHLAAQDDPRIDELALRTVLLAGERPAPAELPPWTHRRGWHQPRLYNLYGITETTVESAAQQFEPADVTSGLNRAGRPFTGIGVVVLDGHGEPVPVGVPGEIHLAGHGLARGYLGRPDLTAARFVPNPFGANGSRLYRSGDLGRLLPDGSLEVLGRIDDQVKIRGYRVEPGEIAAQLRRCPGVRDAVVTVHDGDVLMATVVPDPEIVLDAAALVQWCAERLPDYMVPAAVAFRDELPLTATGKIDRAALDGPDRAAMPALRSAVAARTDVEARLVQVWREVLDLDEIGVEDSFFQLGGDSIRVLTLVTRMRAAGFPAAVRDVFEQQTIARLAELLTGRPAPVEIEPVAPFALLTDVDRDRLPAGLTDAYPLSQVQLGMVVQTLTDGDVNAYQSVNSFLVENEPWAPDALRAAVADLPSRHETLRTSIDLTGYSVPLQLVHRTAAIPLRIVDLRELDEAEQRRVVAEFVAEQGRELFDLTLAPLTRFTVHRLADERWRITFTQSHAITEGWSYHRMLMELLADYRDRRDGRVPEYPEPPAVRYADFIAAERTALDSTEDRAFWADLVTEHPRLELPATWRPRGTVEPEMILGGVRLESVEAGLRALAVRARVSMKAVFLAAHLKVLSQLTAQDRFCTGLVWDTRPEASGADRVLGMHLNTLPFKGQRPTGTWTELVQRVFADELATYAHRRLPLPAIQRQAGGTPLLNVIFTYLDFHVAKGDAVDLDSTIANSPTEFDLNVTTLGGLLGLSSTTRVIGRADMDRLSAMYGSVLAAMAADPDGDAGAVHLPDGERERLLHDWNPVVRPAEPALLHERFAAAAAARPDALAVVCGTDRRTYAQVNAQANRLAHHLRSLGVAPDDLVGVSLDRGPELIPTVLGVLKSGAGYLPIDPATPADRRAFMLADSGARLLITTDEPAAVDPDVTVVRLAADAAAIADRPGTDPVAVSTPDNLIYAIYTSGSTGSPKGVLLTHANVDALFAATRDRFAMGADDVWTLFHSYAFDVSVWEMWGALRHGGTLVVVPADVARNPDAFLDLLVDERVTILSQTPSAFRSLVAAAADGDPRIDRMSLRAVVFGGERLDFAALLPWVRRVGLDRPALLNLYGITETTVHSSYHRLAESDFETPEVSRVGLPLAGWTMHVLDPHGRRVPIGVPGEIHVGGPGLARGYLGRPGLTAERFGPDPFAAAPGGRLYRSGDIGRRLADGTIESLGRSDDQVKIRGYRVELGEVAAALSALPEVADAVVLLIEQSLVGYLVPVAGADPAPADLRDRLRRSLPEYMVPAALVTVPAFPTTTNGKLDKAALPRPGFDALARRATFVAPRTPLEDRLAGVWTAALGLDRIGVDDSFFDVGGDSLRAVALVGALRGAGLDVDVRDIFVHQTVARLATELQRRAAAEPGGSTDPVRPFVPVAPFALVDPADRERMPADVVDAYPATMAQVGMAVEAEADPDRGLYTIVSSFRIRDRRPLDEQALAQAIAGLVARHDVLRTSVHLTGYSEPLQLVHRTATVPVHVLTDAILSDSAGPYLAGFAAADRTAGMDLAGAPLLRVAACQENGAWWLTLTISHLIIGGWDFNSLLADLVTDYQRRLAGDSDPRVAPDVRFADFVAAERQAVADPAERAYWRNLVVDHPPLRLPAAWAASADADAEPLADRHVSVSYRDLDADLRALAARCGTSVKAVLHAAHLKVMSQLTELDEFSAGLVADARPEEAGAERVLGMYINSLPFPHRSSARTWAELVRAVFAAELGIWPHRRFPLGAITAAAGQAGNGPLLEVLFDFNDFHQVDEGVVDVEASQGDATTEFPLTVSTVGGLIHLSAGGGRIGAAELGRLAATYRAVLESMAADPDGDAQATFLAPAERVLVTREWPRGEAVPPTGTTAPAAFARQVAATPAATAVTFAGGALSYADLDRRAGRIARGLIARGVAPGDMVGVLLDRGPDLVAALLGVWQAGAAFVPLDPAHPTARLADMLADVRAGTVIADRAVDLGVPAVSVADLIAAAAGNAETVELRTVEGDLPAYVIFTSGSTGRPKGVLISHRNLWSYLHPWATGLATRGAGGAPLFSSPAVDFSMTVLWGPLCTGRRLALAPAELDLADLGRWLAGAGPFGFVSLTPAHLQLLDEQIGAGAGATVAPVYLVGGEALPTELAARWSAGLGDGGLINEYGPTEITVANCAFALPAGDQVGRIPIGRPLPGTTAYVLDSRLQPVPAGAPGEIWVGGDGVALGYVGRPELTADRFRPDPYGPPGARLYRTGDLGRWLPGGVLDCLGRADEQVKIRGHRIELGEIRAVLVDAGAHDAAVLVRDGRLVAWVVGAVTEDVLRERCVRRLPAPMIPAAFVRVDALPITPNGKLDRRALPDPVNPAGPSGSPPVGAAEEFVANVWSRRLGVEIGRDDDFFDRGGDSLSAVGVVGELRAAGYAVSVRDLFARRTVRALAAGLDQGTEPEPATVAPFALLEPADRTALPDGLTDAYPMSQVQLGMLAEMVASRGPVGRGAYHSVLAHRIGDDRPLDPDALQAAVDLVLSRHDTLRTSFALSGFSVPLQLVHRRVELPVAVVDGRGLDAAGARTRLDEHLATERASVLDPARAPQLRLAANLEDDRAWWLTISVSHAITEGWSLQLLVEELLEAYRQLRDGAAVGLPTVPDVRYADFVAGELAALADPGDAAYWRGITADYPAARPPTGWQDSGPRAVTRAEVDLAGRVDRLRNFARTTGVPLKAVLHAVHLKVLGQLTGDAAYASGLVCDARPEVAGADRLLGMFLNTVPFGHDRTTGSWRELARRVFDREVQLWPHRRFPVPAIQRAAGLRVVEILFNYQDFGRPKAGPGGSEPAAAVRSTVGEGATEFALSVIASPAAFELQSDSTVLGQRSLVRVAGMIDAAVDALLADPDGSAARLCLPAGERVGPESGSPARAAGSAGTWAAGTVSAGAMTAPTAPTATIAELFAAQAAATPDAVAVVAGDRRLTYAELDARANRLAHRLVELGAGPGSLVGVCLDRGPDLIPTLLGVLKSGAAYLPLDPVQPPDRLAYMLGDAGAPIVITRSAQRPLLPTSVDGTVLLLDDEDLTDRPATAPVTGCRADDLVYVIYTSGSTGRPKGVCLTHANVLRLIETGQEHYAFDETDSWPLFHSFAFDVSVWEMWGALLHGGRLVVVPEALLRSPGEFLDLLVEHRVTVLNQTPSAFRSLVDLAAAGDPRMDRLALRAVVFAGERLDMPMLAPWVARHGLGRVALVNMYGITETTVHTTYHRITRADLIPGAANRIGRPLADLSIELTDSAGEPVPSGVIGEINVSGPGVARGYLARPALTADRFVPDPHGPPGSRRYRSGDRARRLPDGTFEFCGRIDDQLKIRGFRIEPGEVRGALTTHPAVADALVVGHTGPAGPALVAYVVPVADEPAPTPADLRAYLLRRLPEYMVPGAYLTITAFPLTPNGKLDKRALPVPELAMPARSEFVAPSTTAQRQLAEIWSRILGVPDVGLQDRFFDLGGHSIAVVRVVAEANAVGLEPSLRMLYENHTLAELAAELAPAAPAADPATVGAGPDGLVGQPRPPARAVPSPGKAMAEHRVPGVSIAMLAGGEVTRCAGFGVVHDGGDPVGPETIFPVASVSKLVTAVGALHLVRRGVLDLDVDVNRYLSRWRVPGDLPVSLRQLLGHTSGLTAPEQADYPPGAAMPGLVDLLAGRPPVTSPPIVPELVPGAEFRAANSNYAVVQQLIGEVTGKRFADFMREQVFGPLGMRRSSFDPPDPAGTAWGHDAHGRRMPDRWRIRPDVGAAGLFSTAPDLARIAIEIRRAALNLGPNLLGPELAGQMLRSIPGAFYGLGTLVDDSGADVEYGHTGECTGFRALVFGRLRSGDGIVVLTNGDAGNGVFQHLAAALAE